MCFQGSVAIRGMLNLLRFLASSHVVLGHLFARGVTAPIYFFHWGFTWVCLGGESPVFILFSCLIGDLLGIYWGFSMMFLSDLLAEDANFRP